MTGVITRATPVPAPGLPGRVRIYEVGPRDGLQNEQGVIPVEVKEEFVRRLLAAGLPVVEATSFVHPRWVPQLADAAELMTRLGPEGVECPVLVPNERGLDRALELGLRHVAVFASATETFAAKNLNRTLDSQLEMFAPTVERALAAGMDVRGYVSMCFGDPWEGPVEPEQVVTVGQRLLEMGVGELSLGDTIGVGTAGHVTALVEAFTEAGTDVDRLALHFHDTYGQALANIYASLLEGVQVFDSSVAGLGGCPYAEGATGNVASEDVLYLLNGLGIETGVDLGSLIEAGNRISETLKRPNGSRVARAKNKQHA